MSRWYDVISGPFGQKYTDAGLQQLAPQPGEKALEIGYGTGYALVSLAKAVGQSGKVHGIDISDKMKEIAQHRVRKAGLLEQVELVRGDATKLPYAENFFDLIHMSFTLELFPDKLIPVLLQECRRVLRPGGRLGVVAMSNKSKPTWMLRLYNWSHKAFPAYVDCRPIFAAKLIEQAGFAIINDKEMNMWGLPVTVIAAQNPEGL
ncbi:MAG: class I SAM-dependent methyltransferase [Candidatus Saganbacteria bacterium]|nr:class I SAM-dependent methyltransferase [Candidatus Saganbacteria bacterium]